MPLVLDGTNGVSGVDGTASNPAIEGTDSNTGIFYPAADTVAIGTGGTEALRVNSSQQVGIGTSSPAYKLDVNGTSKLLGNVGVGGNPSASTNIPLYVQNAAGQDTQLLLTTTGVNNTVIAFNNSGVTNAQGVPNNTVYFGSLNTYPVAITNAGNLVATFSTSGNMGIGTTSPASKLHISGGTANTARIDGSSNGGAWAVMRNGSVTGGIYNTGAIIGDTTSGVGIFAETGLDVRFYTNGSATERARITSGGIFELRSTLANGAYVKSGENFTLASNATINITGTIAGAALVLIYNVNDGAGAVFFANYLANSVKIAGDGAATDTGTTFAVYKNASSHVTTIRNRYATSQTFRIAVYSAEATP
jgi:hypothetical protein